MNIQRIDIFIVITSYKILYITSITNLEILNLLYFKNNVYFLIIFPTVYISVKNRDISI